MSSILVYLGLTCLLMGFSAWMTGAAVAGTWRPLWQVITYCLLLGFADRFLVFSLFAGQLLSLSGYMIDTATLLVIGLAAFRMRTARLMTQQYPWLYKRSGPFSWRSLNGV